VILIPGNSGCEIEIVSSDKRSIVRKTTRDKEYIRRLRAQFLKQISFSGFLSKFKNIDTPQIFHSSLSDNQEFSFSMEYKNFLDCIGFFSFAKKDDIDLFFNLILSFIKSEVDFCKNKKNCMKEFIAKYNSTISKINKAKDIPDSLFSKINDKIYESNHMLIPVGICHGDLTMSNILVSRDFKNLSFIDFLDNFVETPLQDMVKIRQDTRFLWTSHLYSKCFDDVRNRIIMEYLDNLFHNSFLEYEFYRDNYERFQILNILRIFRYTSSKETKRYLTACLESMCD